MLKTSDFPQANNLEKIFDVIEAISSGHTTDSEIENFTNLDSSGRQGRYYRLAAENLGLIENDGNHAALTALGSEFATITSRSGRLDFLARCLIDTPLFNQALKYIYAYHPTDDQLRQWFIAIYPGSKDTASRRFSTFFNYISATGLLKKSGGLNYLKKYAGTVASGTGKNLPNLTQQRGINKHPPKKSSKDYFQFNINSQKIDRANLLHWKLIDFKASFLNGRGYEYSSNQHIDLFTTDKDSPALYEMKSIADNGINAIAQIRKAISQLYEYRYIYNLTNAKLCIVTNYDIGKEQKWVEDYLNKDRHIAYEWTENFKTFNCSTKSNKLLGNLAP